MWSLLGSSKKAKKANLLCFSRGDGLSTEGRREIGVLTMRSTEDFVYMGKENLAQERLARRARCRNVSGRKEMSEQNGKVGIGTLGR